MEFVDPTPAQRRLLEVLTAKWPGAPKDWIQRVKVCPMNDGGMGSLDLHVPESPKGQRAYGSTVAEVRFKDEDGVDVIASLNVDEQSIPLELDLWKTDFSPLIRIPERFETD
jgi:hypothetical protein